MRRSKIISNPNSNTVSGNIILNKAMIATDIIEESEIYEFEKYDEYIKYDEEEPSNLAYAMKLFGYEENINLLAFNL